jgi:peptidoglycan/xylan/chitin deacetylase (PgdA/CDA1 family)
MKTALLQDDPTPARLNPVTDLNPWRVRVQRILAGHLARRLASRDAPSPMISFTFDDFPRSALHAGGKQLTEHGLKGTYYASLGLMGQTTELGPMFTRDDLVELLATGHELACHTLGHTSCLAADTAGFLDSCRENRRQAGVLLQGYQLRNMSFPYGHVGLMTKRALRSAYETCRSTEPGINLDPVDLSFLRANPMYSRNEVTTLKRLMDANCRANGWLVLYTHDVAERPSPYGCTPQLLEQVLRHAAESGAEVLPICQAVSRFLTPAASYIQ